MQLSSMTKNDSVGKVVHWYDKIGVAVVKLNKSLDLGAKVKIKHGPQEFQETIGSMEFDHQPIKSGKKGQEVAIKLSQKAGEGSELCLVE